MKLLYSANLVALSLVGLAAYLVYLNRPGWGWVVFAALLCTVTAEYKKPAKINSSPPAPPTLD